MKSKFLAWVSAVSAVALVSGILVVTANAHIGASHSPFTTDGPDLRSASVVSDDTVDYCFDEEVAEEGVPADYDLGGYDDGQALGATDVELGSLDDCIEVTFDPTSDQDIRNYTIAMVADDSVEDRGGDTSVEGTVELDGSTAPGDGGQTSTAPNLTGFDAQGNNQIAFTFDEPVDCGILTTAGDAATFIMYEDDGAIEPGDAITDCDGQTVDVQFSAGTAPPDVDDAERVAISNEFGGTGDVCDPDPGDDGCLEEESEAEGNEIDDHPDLTDVERTDDNQWLFTFDEDLDDTTITSNAFFIVEEDGTEHVADVGTCDTDNDNDVECTFDDPGIEDAADSELPYGSVDDCAVLSDVTTPPGECSTAGDAPAASTGEEPGLTDGPDLETISKDAPGELVTFNYDEPIDDDFAAVAADFFLFDVDGDKSTGGDIDDQEGSSVTVEFDEDDINDAVGGGSETGATPDWLGDDSPLATVGTEAASSSGGGGTSTTTSTTTTTTTTTSTTGGGGQKRKVATTLTIRYDRDANTFKGSAGSARKGCQRGRLVTLKKARPGTDAKVGSDTTNRAGNWKVRKRVRKGRFYAKVAKKVFTAKNGDRVVCLTDKSPTIKI